MLQHHGFTGLGRADDQAALSLAYGRDQIDDAPGDIFCGAVAALEHKLLGGKLRRQVFKKDLVLGLIGFAAVELFNLEQGKITFARFGGPDFSGQMVAGTQVEAADLRWRYVKVRSEEHTSELQSR